MSIALLNAVAADEAPLAVYADWCEEQGLAWASGVRWMAETDRWPNHDADGWYWRLDFEGQIGQRPGRAILPEAVWRALHPGELEDFATSYSCRRYKAPASYPRFGDLAKAITQAAEAYTRAYVDASQTSDR